MYFVKAFLVRFHGFCNFFVFFLRQLGGNQSQDDMLVSALDYKRTHARCVGTHSKWRGLRALISVEWFSIEPTSIDMSREHACDEDDAGKRRLCILSRGYE